MHHVKEVIRWLLRSVLARPRHKKHCALSKNVAPEPLIVNAAISTSLTLRREAHCCSNLQSSLSIFASLASDHLSRWAALLRELEDVGAQLEPVLSLSTVWLVCGITAM